MSDKDRIDDALALVRGIWTVAKRGGVKMAEDLLALEKTLLEVKSSELAMKVENFTLKQEIAALKQQVAEVEQFDAEGEHFEAKPQADGALAMVPKPGKHPRGLLAQPGVALCVKCFLKRELAVLQPFEKRSSARFRKCHTCGSEVMFEPPHQARMDLFGDGY